MVPGGRPVGPDRNALDAMIKRSGVSMADVARGCGVTEQAVQSWCTGRTVPGVVNAAKLAAVLGVTVDEVITAVTAPAQGQSGG